MTNTFQVQVHQKEDFEGDFEFGFEVDFRGAIVNKGEL